MLSVLLLSLVKNVLMHYCLIDLSYCNTHVMMACTGSHMCNCLFFPKCALADWTAISWYRNTFRSNAIWGKKSSRDPIIISGACKCGILTITVRAAFFLLSTIIRAIFFITYDELCLVRVPLNLKIILRFSMGKKVVKVFLIKCFH